eukprot:2163915-Pyramimonas_sp.AAC.1
MGSVGLRASKLPTTSLATPHAASLHRKNSSASLMHSLRPGLIVIFPPSMLLSWWSHCFAVVSGVCSDGDAAAAVCLCWKGQGAVLPALLHNACQQSTPTFAM